LAAVTVNLSVGGVAVQFGKNGHRLHEEERCVVTFVIPDDQVELRIPAVVVHQEGSADAPIYGLQFLSQVDPEENENRDKVIWRFLLAEQRRQRQSQKTTKSQ